LCPESPDDARRPINDFVDGKIALLEKPVNRVAGLCSGCRDDHQRPPVRRHLVILVQSLRHGNDAFSAKRQRLGTPLDGAFSLMSVGRRASSLGQQM